MNERQAWLRHAARELRAIAEEIEPITRTAGLVSFEVTLTKKGKDGFTKTENFHQFSNLGEFLQKFAKKYTIQTVDSFSIQNPSGFSERIRQFGRTIKDMATGMIFERLLRTLVEFELLFSITAISSAHLEDGEDVEDGDDMPNGLEEYKFDIRILASDLPISKLSTFFAAVQRGIPLEEKDRMKVITFVRDNFHKHLPALSLEDSDISEMVF